MYEAIISYDDMIVKMYFSHQFSTCGPIEPVEGPMVNEVQI